MTQEEKAKAYDEALEKAKDFYKGYKQRDNQLYANDLETIFPELYESEDERIRKHLISLVKNWDKDGIFSKYTSNANDIKQILAWLKKQEEKHKTEPQSRWRPSEEQMDALAWALSLAKNCGEECAFDLRTLQEQLKNL